MSHQSTKRRLFIQKLSSAAALSFLTTKRSVSKDAIELAPPICMTCGTQFPPSRQRPELCPICEDERQYVGLNGQQWTTLSTVQTKHFNIIKQWDAGVYSIHTSPKFGIGQRAFLIQTDEGNLLWDCVSLIDPKTIHEIQRLGGVDAIAISHPHYYSSMIEWSRSFDNAPVYLHENDKQWVMRTDGPVHFWSGKSRNLFGQLSLIHTPGHFEGFQVLHKPGVLFAGDQPQVCMDKRWVSFMYSYPNYVPLAPHQIKDIVGALSPLDFGKLYGAFPHQNIRQNAKEIISRSAKRYIQAIS